MNQMNILVTSPSFYKIDGDHKSVLEKHFKMIDYLPGPHDGNTMMKYSNKYDGIICGDDVIDDDFIKKSVPKLKVISKYGIGLDKIDIDSLKKNNVKLYNCAGVNSTTVAEHALGLLICGAKNILSASRETSNKIWNRKIGNDLSSLNLGIIGYGNVGKEVERLSNKFFKKIIIYDIKFDDKIYPKNIYENNINNLLLSSDLICLCLSLNKSTRRLVNEDFINHLSNDTIIVNVSRGEIVDEDAIAQGIKKNKIKNYITDVLEDEINFLNSDLVDNEKVFITPHIASRTYENIKRQGLMASENLLKGLNLL